MVSHATREALRKAREGTPKVLPKKAVSREPVADGFLVSIRVPLRVERGARGLGGKPYLLKKVYVVGGRFCIHIYGDQLDAYRNKDVRFSVAIERKTFDDGSVEYYANATKTDELPTHRLVTYQTEADYTPQEGDVTFPVASGVVVITRK